MTQDLLSDAGVRLSAKGGVAMFEDKFFEALPGFLVVPSPLLISNHSNPSGFYLRLREEGQ